MAEITKTDIFDGIAKLQRIGKKLPYMDRIRTAEDKDKSLAQLMDELVQTWWDLLAPKHINVETWNQAVDRACFTNAPNTQIIQPAIVLNEIKELEREYLEKQRTTYRAEKEAEARGQQIANDDIREAMRWTYATMAERRYLYAQDRNAIMEFMSPVEDVIAKARKMFGLTEAEARGQLSILRCWDNDLTYSKATGKKAKSVIVFDGKRLGLKLV